MPRRCFSSWIYLAAALLLSSCDGNVQHAYSNYRASLRITSVSSVPSLFRALNGTGEFATIQNQPTAFVFQTLTTSDKLNKTAADVYYQYRSIGGFIVGRTTLTEMGTDIQPLVCYDLACPNCWREQNIAKPLALREYGKASCPRCSRAYDLNNFGLLSAGDAGVKLERYRLLYANNILQIQNK